MAGRVPEKFEADLAMYRAIVGHPAGKDHASAASPRASYRSVASRARSAAFAVCCRWFADSLSLARLRVRQAALRLSRVA